LWSLWSGLQDFPESPPPGLVTIPNLPEVPRSHYTLSGYHPSGVRAIRIDMLERLADILRTKDSRVGFEATPDMLSITGMTLEQFVDLMGGLGYKGEKAERVKVKAVPVIEVKPEEPVSLNPVPEEVSLINPVVEELAPEVVEAPPEMESFVTFTWAPKPRPRLERPARPERTGEPRGERSSEPRGDRAPRSGAPRQDRNADRGPRREAAPVEAAPAAPVVAPVIETTSTPAAETRPRREGERGGYKGNKPREGGGENRGDRSDRKPRPKDGEREGGREGGRAEAPKPDAKPQRSFEARPPRVEKPIDPDNPFAVLAALKLKK
jgi:ATP-dependent RNA helicase SUPV3L1/SUV3